MAHLPLLSEAQDTAAARQWLRAGQLAAAKEQVDLYMAAQDGAGNRGGWLLKAEIYAAIAADAQWKYLVPDGREVALAAIKTALQVDAKSTSEYLKANGYQPLPLLYRGWVAEGTGFFNTATERKLPSGYAQALELFKKALGINALCMEQGWVLTLQPNIAITQYNAAQSAINAGNEDAAVLYARQLADAGIMTAGPYHKADFANIYQWLVHYYHQKQEMGNLQTYATKGANIYPDSPYFVRMLINCHQATGEQERLLAVYEKAVAQFGNDNELLYGYCACLYGHLYQIGKKEAQKEVLAQKLTQKLSKYLQKQPNSAQGWLLMGKHCYNQSLDLRRAKAGEKNIETALSQAEQHLRRAIELAPDKTGSIYQQGILLLQKIGR